MTRGRLLALLLSLALFQTGCSTLKSWVHGSEGQSAAAPDAAASAATGPALYTLDVKAPDGLDKMLGQYLDLARYQRVGEAGAISRSELDRLIVAAPAQARSLLETQGYFNALVDVRRDNAAVPKVTVSVSPGARALIGDVTIIEQGPLLDAEKAKDERALRIAAQMKDAWALKTGEPFSQDAWSSAKNQLIAGLGAQGYPLASWSGTSAQVDPESNRVRLYVVADSGPLFKLGELKVRGLNRYPESVVRNLSTYAPGDVYTEKLLADFQDRLQKSNLFETASVVVDTTAADANAATVTARVRESPQQQATTGIGISTNTGPRLTLSYLDRYPFGYHMTAKNDFEIGRDLKTWDGQLISYPQEDQYRNLLAAGALRQDLADQLLNSWHVRLGRTRETESLERLYYAELLSDSTTTGTISDYARAATLNYNWIFRKLDNILLPTRGMAASLETGGGYAFATSQKNGPLARLKLRVVGYLPFGDSWYSQFRLEGGQVFANWNTGIPDSMKFRAGGDDSVRGYGYRTLGPEQNGITVSGRDLFTASAEIARPISPKLQNIWWAAFIDAGNAADRWSDMSPALGYGLGLRLRSPVGPLRVDVAYGQEVKQIRLHVSIGIAL